MAYTYSGLSGLYDSFRAPAYSVLVGGADIEKSLGVRVQNLTVELDMINEESAGFDLWGFYDLTARALSGKVKEGIKPGKKVEVKLGYGSALTTVFKGYIDKLDLKMSEEESFVWHVSAADVKKLLKEGGKRMRVFETKSYTKVFKSIMSEYGGLCSCRTGTETNAKEPFTLQQKTGDFDFIENKLVKQGLGDWSLCITGGEAALLPSSQKEPPIMTLGPGDGLKSFSCSWSFLNKKIVVQGYTYRGKSKETISVEREVREPFMDSFGPRSVEFLSAGKSAKADLERILNGKVNDYREKMRSESLSCIGLPQLKPGGRLTLDNIDVSLNKPYLIRHVSHSIGDGGFTTNVTAEGEA